MSDERYDSGKDAINRAKHGCLRALGDRIFEDPAFLIIPPIRPEDGVERFKVIGFVEGRLHTGVFVWRDGKSRFISVRRSNGCEERSYRP